MFLLSHLLLAALLPLRSLADLRFHDVSLDQGVGNFSADKTSAASIGDLNRDGYVDIIVCGHVRDPVEAFFGSENGFSRKVYFEDKADRHGTALGDFTGDGFLDVIVTVDGDKPSLPRVLGSQPDGDLTVVDARDVGLNGRRGRGVAARFADMDGDGDLDLFMLNRIPITGAGPPHHVVYENVGGTFEIKRASGIEIGYAVGMLFTDFNADGIPDIFLFAKTIQVFQGRSGFRFEEVTDRVLPEVRDYSFSGAVELDFDNDGDFDIYLGSGSRGKNGPYKENDDILLENRNGVFVNVASEYGLPEGGVHTGVTAADFDNDGWVDIFLPTEGPNDRITDTILLNGKGREFVPVSHDGRNGPADMTRPTGAQALDFNMDGKIDVVVTTRLPVEDGYTQLFENRGDESTGNFIVFVMPMRNLDGHSTMNSLLKVSAGSRTWYKKTGVQGEFRTQSFDTNVHFGLGLETSVKQLQITLSTGVTFQLSPRYGFPANSFVQIREIDITEGDTSLPPTATPVVSTISEDRCNSIAIDVAEFKIAGSAACSLREVEVGLIAQCAIGACEEMTRPVACYRKLEKLADELFADCMLAGTPTPLPSTELRGPIRTCRSLIGDAARAIKSDYRGCTLRELVGLINEECRAGLCNDLSFDECQSVVAGQTVVTADRSCTGVGVTPRPSLSASTCDALVSQKMQESLGSGSSCSETRRRALNQCERGLCDSLNDSDCRVQVEKQVEKLLIVFCDDEMADPLVPGSIITPNQCRALAKSILLDHRLAPFCDWVPVFRIVQNECKRGYCNDNLLGECNGKLQGRVNTLMPSMC